MQVLKYGQQKCRVESSTATKRNELVLYYCAWQSELGHQGSKGSKYIGLKRVSTHILNSMYGVRGGHRMRSKAYPSVFIWYSILHFYEIKVCFSDHIKYNKKVPLRKIPEIFGAIPVKTRK